MKANRFKAGNLEKTTDYIGNFIYENGSLKMIITDDGRLLPNDSGFDYEYNIKDHLGNTRVTVKDSLGFAVVEQEDHYYPFGMRMEGQSYTNPLQAAANKYLYNGKELQDDLGLDWYDYGARFYDAQIGRWSSIDPLAGKYFSYSPFNYVLNNPITHIDPRGLDVYYYDKSGNMLAWIVIPNSMDVAYKVDINAEDYGIKSPLVMDFSNMPVPDAIGIGLEGSGTLGGGANYGWEMLFFTRGPQAFTQKMYAKLGVNIGLEVSAGFYGFFANYNGEEADITEESWKGWFSSYSGGAAYGASYFWSTFDDKPEIDPSEETSKGHKKAWSGWSLYASLPGIPSELKFGAKWSASHYWQIPYWMYGFYTQTQDAFVSVDPVTGEFEDGTSATVEGN